MRAQVRVAITLAALALATVPAAAQGTDRHAATPSGASAVVDHPAHAWSGSATLFQYFVPEGQDYAQPTFAADHGRWHLEARYNYEALKTGSAWIGYGFSAGQELKIDLTPMLGGVFGDLHGVAPGYALTLDWSRLELYSESEYFFDFEDTSGDFFYHWTELSISPTNRWRAGLVIQRTRAYQTSLDLQRGLLAGVSYQRVNLTAYVFNLGWEDPTVVISADVSF